MSDLPFHIFVDSKQPLTSGELELDDMSMLVEDDDQTGWLHLICSVMYLYTIWPGWLPRVEVSMYMYV